MLGTIFQQASLLALHTGIAAGVSHQMGGNHPMSTGFTSYIIGVPTLIAGAFAGDAITRTSQNDANENQGSVIGGLLGYATGSCIGFALKHS